MEFEYSDSLYVSEADLEEMVNIVKNTHCSVFNAISEVACGWEDSEFYVVGLVEEQIAVEIIKRLNRRDNS